MYRWMFPYYEVSEYVLCIIIDHSNYSCSRTHSFNGDQRELLSKLYHKYYNIHKHNIITLLEIYSIIIVIIHFTIYIILI